uniref:Uncharacterized protein n=1 Tax=Plectus sambesii TaxID=2011161 RepID=A0A914UYJ9_9BILA
MKTLQRRSSINYKRPQSTISAVAGLPARPALTTGSKHSATLSYVHDPAKFFVQFDDEQQALRQLYDTLASLY